MQLDSGEDAGPRRVTGLDGRRRARFVAAAILVAGAAVTGLVWRSSSPPPRVVLDAPASSASEAPTPGPPPMPERLAATDEGDSPPTLTAALEARRRHPDWKVVMGIARQPGRLLGVRCSFEAFGPDGEPVDVETIAGPAASFAVEMPLDVQRLRVTPIGRFQFDAADVTVPASGIDWMEIALREADGAIAGRVVDEDGAGVRDVRVRLAGSNAWRMTDAGGWFRFHPLRDGTYSVLVSGAAFSATGRPSQQTELVGGLQTPALLFTIPVGATLTGRTVEVLQGAPIAGVRVHLLQPGGGGQRTEYSDEEGEFSFARLAPGDYELVASTPRGTHGLLTLPVVALAADERRDVTLSMTASAGSIHGRVVDPRDTPLPFARVLAVRRDAEGTLSEQRSATSDSSGRFRFDGVATGEWEVVLEPGWSQSRNWLLPAAQRVIVVDGMQHDVRLQLAHGAWITGVVRSASDRKGLQVRVRPTTGAPFVADVDGRGKFTVGGLRAGSCGVEIVDAAQPEVTLYQTRVFVTPDDPAKVDLQVQ